MAPLHFSCTSCGRCCHGLRLALSVAEAMAWTRRGGLVEILCHAAPDLGVAAAGAAWADDAEDYRRGRWFAAQSGSLAIRVQLILAARFEGACPNLLPDMRCDIYDQRPNVCRTYPAEIMPGRSFASADRLCPPEAWSDRQPLFRRDDGTIADRTTRDAIADARLAGPRDLGIRRALATWIGLDRAALENEGYAVWTMPPAALTQALLVAERLAQAPDHADPGEWRFLSLRPQTVATIKSVGATVVSDLTPPELDYLPLY